MQQAKTSQLPDARRRDQVRACVQCMWQCNVSPVAGVDLVGSELFLSINEHSITWVYSRNTASARNRLVQHFVSQMHYSGALREDPTLSQSCIVLQF